MDSTNKFLCIFTLVLSFLISFVRSQQPYIGAVYTNCGATDNTTGAFGYTCTTTTTPSCQSYLLYRSNPPYTSVQSISDLLNVDPDEVAQLNSVSTTATFPLGQDVVVPANCSCSGGHYQSNATHAVVSGDTYFTIANTTYQGLTTCHALQAQNSYLPQDLAVGLEINVPMRCACPSVSQSGDEVRYLLSYLVREGDDVQTVSERFGVTMQSVLDANQLTEANPTILFFTTLLIPLREPPSVDQILAPSPPLPPPPPPLPPPPGSGSSNRTWVYVVVGVVVAAVLVSSLVIGFCFYSKNKKKKKATVEVVSENFKDVEKDGAVDLPKELVVGMSDIGQTLKVYKFEELKLATNNFSSDCNLGGSVYRGVIKGDLAAIKQVSGDVTEEVNLLKKINHFNLIRLSGVCFGEGHWYLVYEFAEKGSLSRWIHSKDSSQALSWIQRLQIVVDVAIGLNYLHSYTKPGYVHKDVSSNNILVDANFRAKIANFGSVRSTKGQDAGGFHLTRHIIGTKGYLAPEYLENGLISPMLDVYAFGLLMAEVISGNEAVIFRGGTEILLADVFRRLFGKEKVELEDMLDFMDPYLGGDYPQDLVLVMTRLIQKCLQKDPMARPSMEQAVQSLTGLLTASLSLEFPSKDISESRSFATDV